jgi:hypothetical protein
MHIDDLKIFNFYSYEGIQKQRIGSKYDGGYVICLDIDNNYDIILSGGAGNNISFEEELISILDQNCVIYDHTVDIQNINNTKLVHTKTRLNKDNQDFFNLINAHNNIFLKLDIEDGEYELLEHLNQEQVQRFKQIVIEIHNPYLSHKLNLVKKLFINHKLIHLHANNCCGTTNIIGIEMPKIIELTLIRNDMIPSNKILIPNTSNLPTELDFPNLNFIPEIQLDYYPFVLNH